MLTRSSSGSGGSAFATLPPSPEQRKAPNPNESIARIALSMSASMSTFSSPVTGADRDAFAESVDKYEKRLREWLASFDTWRRDRSLVFVSHVRFENQGRVPAVGVRVQLHFPEEFQPAEELPELD